MNSKVWFWILFGVLLLSALAIVIFSPVGWSMIAFLRSVGVAIGEILMIACRAMIVVFSPLLLGTLLAIVLDEMVKGVYPDLNIWLRVIMYLLAAFVFGYLAMMYFYASGAIFYPLLIAAVPFERIGSFVWLIFSVIFVIAIGIWADWFEV